MIKLVILSSTPALRAGLRTLIADDPGITVTAVAGSLDDHTLLADEPQVVVMTRDVLSEAAGRVLAARPALPVLVIADEDPGLNELAQVHLMGENRPWGLISTDAPAEALQAAVRALSEGLVVVSPERLQSLLSSAGSDIQLDADYDEEAVNPEHLTEREIDVLREVARGLTNKQIALALGISEHTVKFHVSSVYAKLGASNRTEAVRKGARRGLIPL